MPRTKPPKKTDSNSETADKCESFVRDFKRLAAQRKHKMEADLKMQISSFENSIDLMLARFPPELRKMTLGELMSTDLPDENVSLSPVPKTVKNKKKTMHSSAVSDDGYATESTMKSTRLSRINTSKNTNVKQVRNARSSSNNRQSSRLPRSTRSTSRSRSTRPTINSEEQLDKKNLLSSTRGVPKTTSKFLTPSAKNGSACYDAVTPKVKPNTPMNILRRPKDGEMVLSMQGSPLLISSIVQERMANINVPLHNGAVMSLLPNKGLRLSQLPDLDATTMRQLKTLKSHIEQVIGTK